MNRSLNDELDLDFSPRKKHDRSKQRRRPFKNLFSLKSWRSPGSNHYKYHAGESSSSKFPNSASQLYLFGDESSSDDEEVFVRPGAELHRHTTTRHGHTVHDTRSQKTTASKLSAKDNTSQEGHELRRTKRKRSRRSPAAEVEYAEVQIQPGDTLRSLAIKCSCPIGELKRANNLIKEQDFFALKTLRVPIKKHGILSEVLRPWKSEQQLHSSCKEELKITPKSDTDDEGEAIRLQAFLENKDQEIHEAVKNLETNLNKSCAGTSYDGIYVIDVNREEKSQGIGINSRTLVIVLCMFGIILPVACGLYYLYFKPKYEV